MPGAAGEARGDDPIGSLVERIRDRTATVGVVGLGYVGLPLSVELAQHLVVVGIDNDPATIGALRQGRSHIADVSGDRLAAAIASGSFTSTTSYDAIGECDVVVICVPTPLLGSMKPDLSSIEKAARGLALHLRRGQLVVLESTSYPGTTDEFVRPILEESGLALGEDFLLAFSSERVDPANTDHPLTEVPKVVGGCSLRSTLVAAEFYRVAFRTVHTVSSAAVAEMSKLLENTFRFVNIGLVNEVAHVCRRLGLDVDEVIDAAATKPFGFMPFRPGPGIGGHCIAVDPYYLSWAADGLGVESNLIDAAGRVNDAMPGHVADSVAEALADRGIALDGSRVLLLGVAYKENVPDVRNSPALPLIAELRARGADVAYHDPLVPMLDSEPLLGAGPLRSTDLTESELSRTDCVVVVSAHDAIPFDLILAHSTLVLDTRGHITRRQAATSALPATVVRL